MGRVCVDYGSTRVFGCSVGLSVRFVGLVVSARVVLYERCVPEVPAK